MKKIILYSKVFLQIVLFILSHSLLILATLFPSLIVGCVILAILTACATFYLWKGLSTEALIRTIILMLLVEFIFIFNVEYHGFITKAQIYFSNLNNYLLPSIMFLVIFYLLLKSINVIKQA